MVTTVSAFRDELAGLSVTGVVRNYDHPPQGLNTADLPALYLEPPGSSAEASGEWASACDGTGKVRTGVIVIAIEAAGQDTNDEVFDDYIALTDALETALDAWDLTPFIEYEIGYQTVTLGGTPFWAIRATVTGRGL